MSEQLKHNLKRKGWHEDDINKVLDILYSEDKEKKHVQYKREMNRIVYWSALMVLAIVNLVIAIVLIPFLMVFTSSFALYTVIIVTAFFFGILVNILITDIEHIERKHHLFAFVFIPVIGLVTFIISVSIANGVSEMLEINLRHNPIVVGLVYVIVFIIPYVIANRKVLLER